MQEEQLDAIPNRLVGYVASQCNDKRTGVLGIGLHGYIVTDTLAKRGYGLKNMIPSHRGYIKGDKADLRVVDKVFDGVVGKLVDPACTSSVVALVIGATQILNLAVDLSVSAVWIGLPRIQLAGQMATGFEKQKAAEFKDKNGSPLPYGDILRAYVRTFEYLSSKGVTVTVEHVQETDMGYMAAQPMADLAILNLTDSDSDHFSMVEADGYWNHNHNRHPLLSHPRLIFSGSKPYKGLPEYLYTMDYEKAATDKKDMTKLEIEVGQSLAHARYAVVKLDHQDPLVEKVAIAHCEHHKTKHSNLAVMYLSAVFSKQGNALLSRFGSDILASKAHLTELTDGRGVMFTHDMPIPRKSLRSTQVYVGMEETLKAFEAAYYEQLSNVLSFGVLRFDSPLGEITATEITELLCVVTEGPKEKLIYKPSKLIELPNITLSVDAKLIEDEKTNIIPIKLTIGYDLPTRNTIASVLGEDFKGFLLVYRDTEVTVRHLTVLMSSRGVGIWTTPFAARTFTLNTQ